MSAAPDDPNDPGGLAGVHDRLARWGARTREELLREGAVPADEREELAAREALRRMLADRRRPWRLGRWLPLVLGAAAAVLMLWFWKTPPPETGGSPGGLPLGSGSVRLVHPLGEVDEFERFEWEGERPAGGSFELVLRDASRPDDPPLRRTVPEPRWVPTPEDRVALPQELSWEVRVLDALGKVIRSSAPARARRTAGS